MAPKTVPGSEPRSPLTKERVLRTAIDLADQSGLEALSMRRLGQELGVEAMSLYKHVANKDDILNSIIDMVVGEIALPTPGAGWRAAMRRRAISAHQVLLRHPWACMLMVSRIHTGPFMLGYVNATIGILLEAGLSFDL